MYELSHIVNFAAVLFILFYFLRKPATAFVAGRSSNIKENMDEAEGLFKTADSELNTWKSNWESAGDHTKKMMDDAKSSLQKQRDTALSNARNQATRISEDSNRLVQSEYDRARNNVKQEIVDESLKLASQFLDKSLGDGERKKLVEESLELVGHAR